MIKTVIYDKTTEKVLEPIEVIERNLCLDFSTTGELVVCNYDSQGLHNLSHEYSVASYLSTKGIKE